MVDFNSEGTITTPSYEVEKILILEKRENAILALGFYRRQESQSVPPEVMDESKGIFKSRLWELFIQIESWLQESGGIHAATKKPLADWIRESLASNDIQFEELDEIMKAMGSFLFSNGLTKINSKRRYDKGRVEVENAMHQT